MYNFDEILEDDNPEYVETVSELRHYRNIHGLTKKLANHFSTSKNKLKDICDYCRGSLRVQACVDDIENIISQEIERRDNIERARLKNEELCQQFKAYKTSFCNGLGFRKIKLRLNKLAVNNPLAKAIRLLLEIETTNAQAKEDKNKGYINVFFQHTTQEMLYYKKSNLIKELVTVCNDNKYEFGVQLKDGHETNAIIYFDLPNTKQVSYHVTLSNEEIEQYPKYTKEWDGEENSSFTKIEESIQINFPEIILA